MTHVVGPGAAQRPVRRSEAPRAADREDRSRWLGPSLVVLLGTSAAVYVGIFVTTLVGTGH